MKLGIAACLIISTSAFAVQDQSMMKTPPPPKELKKVEFFAQRWTGVEKLQGMGGPPTNAKATMVGKKILADKYIQSMHVADMGKMGKMEGMHLISYDIFKKKYVAFWFDSTSPGVMEMEGNFQNDKLIMVSKPTSVPGMPEPLTMRATWQKQGATKLTFLLEMKQGPKWAPVIQGNFTRMK